MSVAAILYADRLGGSISAPARGRAVLGPLFRLPADALGKGSAGLPSGYNPAPVAERSVLGNFFASDAFFIFLEKGLTQDDMEAKIREKIEENQRIFAADLKELLGESNERFTLQELTDQHQGG